MDMLTIHAAALASGNIAYHEFLLCYREGEKIVYGLVEGRDDPCFYRGIIEHMLPDGWEVRLIRAGNKDKVLKALNGMDWTRFPRKRVCFFVDRDLSDFLVGAAVADASLYTTDKYSIDSEIVCGRTFERVLEEVLGLTDPTPAENAAVRTLFDANLGSFCDAMAPVMAQVILWRRAGANVSLDNIEPKELFSFGNGQIALRPQFSLPKARIQHAAAAVNATAATDGDIAAAEDEFRRKDGISKLTRGKYLLWFFVQFAKHIHQEAPKFFSKHKAPPKARVELGVGNAMAVVAPRVRCPESLRVFLDQTFVDYARNGGATS